jgi:acyl carrier protein
MRVLGGQEDVTPHRRIWKPLITGLICPRMRNTRPMTFSTQEVGQTMPATCSICGDVVADGAAHCQECAQLLRWVRGYFAHVSGLDMQITPQTAFNDLGADSLDWMNWLLEAEEKLGIAIPDRDVERLRTVGQFIQILRARGASWAPDDDIRLKTKGGCFRNYAWEKVRVNRQ